MSQSGKRRTGCSAPSGSQPCSATRVPPSSGFSSDSPTTSAMCSAFTRALSWGWRTASPKAAARRPWSASTRRRVSATRGPSSTLGTTGRRWSSCVASRTVGTSSWSRTCSPGPSSWRTPTSSGPMSRRGLRTSQRRSDVRMGIAMAPPRGPVLVSIPSGDWEEPAPPECMPVGDLLAESCPSEDAVRELARRLGASHRPAMVTGAGLDSRRGWAGAVKLAEALCCPVWAAPQPGATIRRTVADWQVRKEPDYQLQYRFGGWWTRLPPASEHARGIHGTAAGEQQELARKPPAGCMRGSQRLGLLR